MLCHVGHLHTKVGYLVCMFFSLATLAFNFPELEEEEREEKKKPLLIENSFQQNSPAQSGAFQVLSHACLRLPAPYLPSLDPVSALIRAWL